MLQIAQSLTSLASLLNHQLGRAASTAIDVGEEVRGGRIVHAYDAYSGPGGRLIELPVNPVLLIALGEALHFSGVHVGILPGLPGVDGVPHALLVGLGKLADLEASIRIDEALRHTYRLLPLDIGSLARAIDRAALAGLTPHLVGPHLIAFHGKVDRAQDVDGILSAFGVLNDFGELRFRTNPDGTVVFFYVNLPKNLSFKFQDD